MQNKTMIIFDAQDIRENIITNNKIYNMFTN